MFFASGAPNHIWSSTPATITTKFVLRTQNPSLALFQLGISICDIYCAYWQLEFEFIAGRNRPLRSNYSSDFIAGF